MSLLASLRERLTIGELSDELARARERALMLQDATTSLITCVKALALDFDELDAARLKRDLDDTLGRVHAEVAPAELGDELRQRHTETLMFAEKERRYLVDRDAELRHIIELLEGGLTALGSDNSTYDRIILDKSMRLEAASQLGDIVKVRQAISNEVGELRRIVADKRARDAAQASALSRELETLRRDVEHARSAAATDALTGAANRGAFDSELSRLCDLATAGGSGFSLLMIDIDHFKAINDTYGHPVGDRVLMALVGFCREHIRRDDMVARWGGEEFAVLLPTASLRTGFAKAHRMVKELTKRTWSIDTRATVTFTISVGVTAWKSDDQPTTTVERADQALYQAKRAGRNRAIKAA